MVNKNNFSEKGESQYVFIAVVLLGAIGFSLLSMLQSCIKETKDEKVIRRKQAWVDAHKQQRKVERGVKGTTIEY